MKKILISVSYTDATGKFWHDGFSQKVVEIEESKDLHDQIAKAIYEESYMTLTYKAKPQGNVYRDTKDGSTKIVGYMYRGKTDIEDRDAYKTHKNVPFDVWVTIHGEIVDYPIEDIDNIL